MQAPAQHNYKVLQHQPPDNLQPGFPISIFDDRMGRIRARTRIAQVLSLSLSLSLSLLPCYISFYLTLSQHTNLLQKHPVRPHVQRKGKQPAEAPPPRLHVVRKTLDGAVLQCPLEIWGVLLCGMYRLVATGVVLPLDPVEKPAPAPLAPPALPPDPDPAAAAAAAAAAPAPPPPPAQPPSPTAEIEGSLAHCLGRLHAVLETDERAAMRAGGARPERTAKHIFNSADRQRQLGMRNPIDEERLRDLVHVVASARANGMHVSPSFFFHFFSFFLALPFEHHRPVFLIRTDMTYRT